MLVTELRELAKRENACDDGLIYLDRWIKNHPHATAVDFFKSQRNIKFDPDSCFSPHGYLRWCFRKLLDWSEVNKTEDIWYYDFTPETLKFIKEVLGTISINNAPIKKITNVLIRAFEEEK